LEERENYLEEEEENLTQMAEKGNPKTNIKNTRNEKRL
jgi:hypothetical protein